MIKSPVQIAREVVLVVAPEQHARAQKRHIKETVAIVATRLTAGIEPQFVAQTAQMLKRRAVFGVVYVAGHPYVQTAAQLVHLHRVD